MTEYPAQPAAAAATINSPAGWYPDPWGLTPWRWWDGFAWTTHGGGELAKKPRLPNFLSVPVVLSFILIIPMVLVLTFLAPVAVLLGLVPLFIVMPVLLWIDRVEPEPRSSKVHAFLWGASVAGLLSIIVNSIVGLTLGETVAAVASAPIIEEITKGAGILWAVRRKEVDSVTDGVVYAGWVALGFAVIEDMTYFQAALADGILVQTFILRAFLTPFAHPLFTAWIGLAIGLAIARGKPLFPNALWGLPIAIATHASWNGSLALTQNTGQEWIVLVAIGLFFLLFVAAIVASVRIRRSEQKNFVEALPYLTHRYGVPASSMAHLHDWKSVLAARKALPKHERKKFDKVHAILGRAAVLHQRPGETDPVAEGVLYNQLLALQTET